MCEGCGLLLLIGRTQDFPYLSMTLKTNIICTARRGGDVLCLLAGPLNDKAEGPLSALSPTPNILSCVNPARAIAV